MVASPRTHAVSCAAGCGPSVGLRFRCVLIPDETGMQHRSWYVALKPDNAVKRLYS